MSGIEVFTPAMIEAALRELGISSFSNEEGDRVASFAGEEVRTPVWAHFCAEGPEDDVYAIRVHSGRYFDPDAWPRLLGLINEWHQKRRWPRVALAQVPNAELAQLECDGHLCLPDGAHQQLVTGFTHQVISGSFSFWSWLDERAPRQSAGMPPTVLQLSLDLIPDPVDRQN